MNLRHRSSQKELLDGEDIPFTDLAQNLRELNTINTLLGGHQITCKGVEAFLTKDFTGPLHIAEIGCGGGDNLRAISLFLQKKAIPHRLTGIDLKPECVKYAQEHSGLSAEIATWICSDYAQVVFVEEAEKPHILFSSLFCHHFSNKELAQQMSWLAQNSCLGFFINDLQRHPLAFYSIKALTRVFSKSYLVKSDAPISVARGFRRAEWEAIFRKAGLPQPHISWEWAFRYLIISEAHGKL